MKQAFGQDNLGIVSVNDATDLFSKPGQVENFIYNKLIYAKEYAFLRAGCIYVCVACLREFYEEAKVLIHKMLTKKNKKVKVSTLHIPSFSTED